LIESDAAPIANPVTGAPQRAKIVLPDGFEFLEADVVSGKTRTLGAPVDLVLDGTHAHLAKIHWSTHGVVH
jgi:hypothetical protein